jgi:hypothetical protein
MEFLVTVVEHGPKQCVVMVRCMGANYLDNPPLVTKAAAAAPAHQ